MSAASDRIACWRVVLPLAVALALALLALLPPGAEAKPKVGDGVGGIELRKLGEFNSPTYVDNAPGFKNLLFVVEQPGTIRVLRGNRTVDDPFLSNEAPVLVSEEMVATMKPKGSRTSA